MNDRLWLKMQAQKDAQLLKPFHTWVSRLFILAPELSTPQGPFGRPTVFRLGAPSFLAFASGRDGGARMPSMASVPGG